MCGLAHGTAGNVRTTRTVAVADADEPVLLPAPSPTLASALCRTCLLDRVGAHARPHAALQLRMQLLHAQVLGALASAAFSGSRAAGNETRVYMCMGVYVWKIFVCAYVCECLRMRMHVFKIITRTHLMLGIYVHVLCICS